MDSKTKVVYLEYVALEASKEDFMNFSCKGGEAWKKETSLVREREIRVIIGQDERKVFFRRSALDVIDFDALEESSSVEFNLERDLLEAFEQ